MYNKLSFEELMEKAIEAKNDNLSQVLADINEEFNRRIKKRSLMGKKPTKTSIAGEKQTADWLKNYNIPTSNESNNQNRAKNLLKMKSFFTIAIIALISNTSAVTIVKSVEQKSAAECEQMKKDYQTPGGWKPDNLVHHPNGHICTGCDFCPGIHYETI